MEGLGPMRRFMLGLGAALLVAAIAAPVAAAANREVVEKSSVASLHFEGLDACLGQGYSFTETGALRHVTAKGEGIVLQQVGRVVNTIDFSANLFSGGPHDMDTGNWAAFCDAL